MSEGDLVSVVLPTFHRPESLRRAVASVLAQELPDGVRLEVVIAVSDPGDAADVEAATALAEDGRCRVVMAAAPGPAAARNAALEGAQGAFLAFIDDDCEARPGWLLGGLSALQHADLVQGRTVPAGVAGGYDDFIAVDPPSWLWECCNLFARRQTVDAAGPFDETWNPTGTDGDHWGEDTVWGWRMVRAGARLAFAEDAVVAHEVRPRGFSAWARHNARIRYYPLLVRELPEARRRFFMRYFIDRRHAVVVACGLTLAGAAVARGSGRRRTANALTALAAAAYARRSLAPAVTNLVKYRVPQDAVELAAAVCGSIRHRRIVL